MGKEERNRLEYLSFELQEKMNTLMLPLMILVALGIAVAADSYVKKPAKRIMLFIDAIVLTLIAGNSIFNTITVSW
ncbi:MAG: hypothetical protein IJ242_10200, partial [Clostridia bacterium]|nr:hypothetical protein [Clostridia bacterium]